VAGLNVRPQLVLVDGNRLPVLEVTAEPVIGGDARIAAIAAASILAKVHRDRLCDGLHVEYPSYGFADHKGYATALHLSALKLHGACPHHRRSFAPVAAQIGALAS
jgi:ribonuclease HII